LRTADFDFLLPPDRIASTPSATRDGSRLLVTRRGGGSPNEHAHFRDLARHLPPRSLLVLNDTRVIPARLRARKPTGGAVEVFLTRSVSAQAGESNFEELWEGLGRGMGNVPLGTKLHVGEAGPVSVFATLVERGEEGRCVFRLEGSGGPSLLSVLDEIGEMPLPPYIEAARREGAASGVQVDDRERYQTVYASAPGAVAAPTAGLHFTPESLEALVADGHELARLTLHVGPGTFRPVKTDDPRAHRMDVEHYDIPASTAAAIARARAEGRTVVAVGTTVVRTLEASARDNGGVVVAGPGSTALFILPGDSFAVVDAMITNFHLPQSTLLMLVCAFAGTDHVLATYREAVERGYRFYSYGDSMLLLPRGAGA
jgi:S-adenosylmethionine:tRNA ribosyltransferase-isomerase